MNAGVLLFEGFETLDVFGPVEILGRLTNLYEIRFYSPPEVKSITIMACVSLAKNLMLIT